MILIFAAAFLTLAPVSGIALAESYPILAYGPRTYVAETTKSGETVLVRVYQRSSSSTWHRFGGFTIATRLFALRRAEVKRNPQAASETERVYFTGQVIGWTPFRPSDPLFREPRFRLKK